VTAIVNQTTSEITELEEFIKTKVQASTAASSDQEKYTELFEAQEAIQKQEELKLEAQELIKMADSVDQVVKKADLTSRKNELAELKSAFESAISSGKQGDAWKGLAEKSETIRSAMVNKSANVIESNVRRQVEIEQQLTSERNKRTALEADKEKVENEVYQLNLTLNAAKKKDQPTIQSAVDKKKEEIQLLEEEIDAAEPKETVLTNQLNILKAELTVIQKATDSQSTSITTTRQEVLKGLSATNSTNSSSLHAFVDQQIGELVKNNPALTKSAMNQLIKTIN
jgi:chromosome segregation ATPase